MARSARIALVTSFSGEGGVERMLVNLMRAFVQLEYQVDLLRVRADGPFARQTLSGVNIIDLPVRHSLAGVFFLSHYLRHSPVQAVLAAKDRPGRALVLARSLSGSKTRVIIRLGTNLSQSLQGRSAITKWLRYLPARLLYPGADHIVAVSEGVGRDISKISRVSASQIDVVPNPVITNELFELAKTPLHHPWFKPKESPVILAAGRLTRQKDFPTLIQAFALVRPNFAARLIILGEGRDRTILQDLIVRLSLQDWIDLPGFVTNPYAYMKQADLFVLSSRWEGSPNVLTEAMALGLPVVATDCQSGPREILQEGRLGPLVPVGDSKALSQAMLRVLQDPLPAHQLEEGVKKYRDVISAQRYLDIMLGKSRMTP
jgi:glycosyltransferase involved in cell wall biosynthesis